LSAGNTEAALAHHNLEKCVSIGGNSTTMVLFMKNALLCCCASLVSLAQAVFADSAAIVLYHHVATDTPASTSLTPDQFRSHLEFIRDNGFEVLALDDLVHALEANTSLPEKTLAITFDDGYLSIFTEAFPVLTEFGFPFTVFISTGPIDQGLQNYMSWDQIRALSDGGVIIANHMVEHPYMLDKSTDQDDATWLANQRQELLQAQNRIKTETGQDHKLFAYPYGEYNDEIKFMIEAQGFVGFAQNSGAVNEYSDMSALPRFPLASIYANLATAGNKFLSKAFNVSLLTPLSPVTTNSRPSATLQFSPGDYSLAQIGCFYNSKAMSLNWTDRENGIVEITPTENAEGRRWRYICTAPDPNSNRFYWYSVQFINSEK
jgi:peptidoglycan/xylan/chitin deacetylase (PgdA/CDA1 family)